MITMDSWQNRLALRWDDVRERWGLRNLLSPLLVLLFLLLLLLLPLGWYWGREPAPFPVQAIRAPAGSVLASVQERMARSLLDKPGGYLNNDLLPPGSLSDDIPAWERGVLREMRDLARVMAPSSLESAPAPDLAEAEVAFAIAPDAWGLPSVEGELDRGRAALARHRERLAGLESAGLVMREEQLQRWLSVLQRRQEDLSRRLNAAQSASLAPGAAVAPGTEAVPATSWTRIDDVFFEARGSAWAQLHLLKAAELDFAGVLQARHADLSLRAAIHELEATQQPLWSPVILNGSGFGLFSNHSLILANYLQRSRARLAEVQAQLATP